jgi:hypothetical protein
LFVSSSPFVFFVCFFFDLRNYSYMANNKHEVFAREWLSARGYGSYVEPLFYFGINSLGLLARADGEALELAGVSNENHRRTLLSHVAQLRQELATWDVVDAETRECKSCRAIALSAQVSRHACPQAVPDFKQVEQAEEKGLGLAPPLSPPTHHTSVADWLRELDFFDDADLERVVKKLAALGADSMQRVSLLTPAHLCSAGVPQASIPVLIQACKACASSVRGFQRKGLSYKEWLLMHDLSLYQAKFDQMGFKTHATIRAITTNDLISMGVLPELHQQHLLSLVSATKDN